MQPEKYGWWGHWDWASCYDSALGIGIENWWDEGRIYPWAFSYSWCTSLGVFVYHFQLVPDLSNIATNGAHSRHCLVRLSFARAHWRHTSAQWKWWRTVQSFRSCRSHNSGLLALIWRCRWIAQCQDRGISIWRSSCWIWSPCYWNRMG